MPFVPISSEIPEHGNEKHSSAFLSEIPEHGNEKHSSAFLSEIPEHGNEKHSSAFLDLSALPAKETIWHNEATVVIGNSVVTGIATTMPHNLRSYQYTATINDKLSWQIRLRPGTYSFFTSARTDTNLGIATWKLNDTTIATHDWYSNPGVDNVEKSTDDISVAGGIYTLSMTMATKHTLSTDYMMQAVQHFFKRTGA